MDPLFRKSQQPLPIPQLENDPTLPPPRSSISGGITFIDAQEPIPQQEQPEPKNPQKPSESPDIRPMPVIPKKPRKTWQDVLSDQELTDVPFNKMVDSANMLIEAWRECRALNERKLGPGMTDRIIQTQMSWEQQGNNPYGLNLDLSPERMTPREAHQMGLVHPYTMPDVLIGQFIDDVERKAHKMSVEDVQNAIKALQSAAGIIPAAGLLKDFIISNRTNAEDLVRAARQYGQGVVDQVKEIKRFHEEVTVPEVKKGVGRVGIAATEAGKALFMDVYNADGATKAIAEASGLDPQGEDVQAARAIGYGVGTVASFATPGLGGLKALNLGLKGIRAASMAGLQGAFRWPRRSRSPSRSC